MTPSTLVLAVLVSGISVFASPMAQAAPPVATIAQLSGQVMAVKPDGRPRILSTASRVEAGDTLVSESGTYVRVLLGNGNEALLGPDSTLKVAGMSVHETVLVLVGGQVQLSGGPQQPPGYRFTLAAGDTMIAAGAASFTATYISPQETAAARRQSYLRSSLAAVTALPATDYADNLPLREVVAQMNRGPQLPAAGGLKPGLHVFVLDGIIQLTNVGGSQAFSSGQFGFVRNNITPPVVVPNNPGLKFTPPPVFSMSNPSQNNNAPRPDTVDCEVR